MRHVILLTAVFAVAILLAHNKVASTPYGYDEADYMFAASLGLESNWIDAGTSPLTEFVRVGTQRGSDPNQRAMLSAIARSSADPVVYRHWHGPLYYYWLAIASKLRLSEHTMRLLSFAFPVLTALVMYFGSLFIVGGAEGQVAGILSVALFLWSPVTLETSELAPHMLFVLLYVCGLMLLAKAVAGGGRLYYYAAVACTALAFSTLEVAFVLIFTLAIFAVWQRERLATDWRLVRNSVGIFTATILAVWPAGLFKLSFLKAYLVMLYLAVFRKGAWGSVTFAQTWARRFALSPVEWSLFAVALVLLVAAGKRRDRDGTLPFLLFAALMILATVKVYSDVARYATPFLAAVDLFTAWTLARALTRTPRRGYAYGATSAICCLLIWNAERQMSTFWLHEDPQSWIIINALRRSGLAEKTLLAPKLGIPTFHYYFPHMRVQGYTNESEMSAYMSRSHFDGILYPDASLTVEPPGQ